MKEDYDGAEPSASAVGAWNLLTLAHLTGDGLARSRAREVFARLRRAPDRRRAARCR